MSEERQLKVAPTGLKLVFKTSYDKANRSSVTSARGIGMGEGLRILGEVRGIFGCPVIKAVHEVSYCPAAAEVVDVTQIPAFLSRQTDPLLAAGNTGKPINVKKDSFWPHGKFTMLPRNASAGKTQIIFCERGTYCGL